MRCTACECSKTSKQVVFGRGNPAAQIVSIGEGPGPDEDEMGEPFCGRAGALYDKLLSEANIPRAKIWTDNTVKCFPGRNAKGGIEKPSPLAIATCTEKWLFKQLAIIKPRVIFAWGLTAAGALIRGNNLPMKDLVGRDFETEYGIVIPLYHPSYFLRNSDDHVNYGKVLTALQRGAVLAGFSSSGTFVDQVKTEHHQEDKRVIAALEAKSGIFEEHPWRTDDREYTQAWTDGTEIWLIYKDQKTKRKKAEVVNDFEWYFYLRTHDVLEVLPKSFWRKWLADGLVHRFRVDQVNPGWTQVFTDRYVVRTTALREHLLESYLTLWDDKTVKKYKEDSKLRSFLDEIESYSVQHFEADLTPTRRFMTDFDIKIQSAYDEMYMDIETDDTLPLGDRLTLGDRRILSIAWEIIWADKSKSPTIGFLLLKGETDRAERELLEAFALEMDKIDIMYAWNGNNFDFPIVRHRMRRYRISAPWEVIHTIDLLRTWIRYFQRGASVNTSYSLQNIAMHVLKQGKIDWKLRARERGLKIHSFLELYRQAPDLLEEYNLDDCHKLVELEKFTGFAKIDQVFSRIGNCFARDYHITTKIDSLLLKRGKQTGTHFKTKKVKIMQEGGKAAYKKSLYADGEVYEGAYVLDPNVGIHEDVAAVDFKSLYPSVMVAWNISPETYLTDEQAKQMDPQDYVTCPTGTKFRVDRKGFVPEIFADTGEKRKVYQDLQKKEQVGSDLFLLYYRLAYCVDQRTRIHIGKREIPIKQLWDEGERAFGSFTVGDVEVVKLGGAVSVLAADEGSNDRWQRLYAHRSPVEKILRRRNTSRRFEITTESGKKVIVTDDHSLIVKRGERRGQRLVVKASQLNLQTDRLYVYDHHVPNPRGFRGFTAGHRRAVRQAIRGRKSSRWWRGNAVKRSSVFHAAQQFLRPEDHLAFGETKATHPALARISAATTRQMLTQCPRESPLEAVVARLMTKLGVRGFQAQALIKHDGVGCHPDFVNRRKRIAFFVDGDYHHVNPAKYPDHTTLTAAQRRTLERDLIVRPWLQIHGWTVLRIWESELKNEVQAILRLKELLKHAPTQS